MTTHDCETGCGKPTGNPHLCKDCTQQLEDALAKLGTWAHRPTAGPVIEWCSLATQEVHGRPIPRAELSRDNTASLPSSIFDTPSGRATMGKTQGLAAELDVQRSRQTRRGSMNGPRLAPDSKVWAPSARLDRVEVTLARAVALWVGRLAKADHSIPTVTVTGATLARACTLLLWHSKDILNHPDAAEAHRAFCDAAKRIEKLVDRPADRVYAGPCWEQLSDGTQCQTDLYATPGAKDVQCRACGIVHNVEYRKAWLADHLEDVQLTATNCARALATIGITVTLSQITMWATRGLESRGRVSIGKRSLALYRVGDVMLLAYKAAEDPRARARTRQSA